MEEAGSNLICASPTKVQSTERNLTGHRSHVHVKRALGVHITV